MEDTVLIKNEEVLTMISAALEKKEQLSLVRIGDGENIVLSQYDVLPIEKVLTLYWVKQGNKGLKLPNTRIKNELINSIKKATIVGVLPMTDDRIKAPVDFKRKLTDKVFSTHDIIPKFTCDACINRDFSKDPLFWAALEGKKILLIYKEPKTLKKFIQQQYPSQNISLCIPFTDYSQLEKTIRLVHQNRKKFDIALISCGVNAVILAQRIAEISNKVCIDFGKGTDILLRKKK